jgi:hypothetical protein
MVRKNVLLIVVGIFLVMFFVGGVSAAVDLSSGYWETTYNCAEWEGTTSPKTQPGCDGLSRGGDEQTGGKYEQITGGANYPGGGGVRGQRHWIGYGCCTGNERSTSGGLDIDFSSPPSKFWMRWYMRFENGFNHDWSHYKMLFLYDDTRIALDVNGDGSINMVSPNYHCSNCGWGYNFYTGDISNGSWVQMELHMDVSSNLIEFWVNGELVWQETSATDISAPNRIRIGSNIKNFNQVPAMYIDYDDIAISTTGYIGPVTLTTECNNTIDGDGNSEVSMPELISYITQWKAGSVGIEDLMTGIGEWKNGC